VDADLVQRDHALLLETSRLHDDTMPFLDHLRRHGIASASVSNCADQPRDPGDAALAGQTSPMLPGL
jgi:hypothetical protein